MPDPSIFTSVINSYLPEPHASLLNGILFGVSLRTTKEFYEQLRAVGLLHIVVLSGINITLLAAIVTGLTESFGKKLSIFVTCFVIVVFIIFVGAKAPIVRAGFMGILSLVAILYGRRNIALYALFLSFLFIAIIWPEWLKTISLQLSYGATLGIILFGNIKTKNSKNIKNFALWQFWKEAKPSIAAQVFTAPLIFFYFKQISFVSVLANVLVAPVIPLLMISGFLTAILGKMHYILGLIPSYISFVFLQYIIIVVDLLSRLPFAFINFSP